MTNWRTYLAVAILAAFSCAPASPQSLGDVARSERERRARMAHHAPMLTDEDLRRDQILKKTPAASDSALPSPDNSTSTTVDENLPLGDYARALRRSRMAEPAPAANAVATGPAPEPQPSAATPVAQEAEPAAASAGHKTTPLGDLAREVRAEREAARRVRIQQKKTAQQSRAQQKAVQPAVQASQEPVHADKAAPAPKAAARVAPAVKTSPKPAQSKEVAAKPSTLPAPKATQPKPAQQKVAPPAVQASKEPVHADKTPPAAQAAHTAPTAAPSPKPAQLTDAAAKPSAPPAPQSRAALLPDTKAGEQSIRVPRGASLWKLARTYLGSGHLWTALWKANPQIHDPNLIRAGQTLRLPDLNHPDNPSSDGL